MNENDVISSLFSGTMEEVVISSRKEGEEWFGEVGGQM